MYVALLHVVNEQKEHLLPEVVKPSAAVYDTVVECDLSRQRVVHVQKLYRGGKYAIYSYPRAVGAIQI